MSTTPDTAACRNLPASVSYLPDATVDAALDTEIRSLLTTCFKKPQDTVFATQRYYLPGPSF